MTGQAAEAVESIEKLTAHWDALGGGNDFPVEVVHAQAALRRFVDAANTARAINTEYGRALAFCVIAHEQRRLAEENMASLQQPLEYVRGPGPFETARVAICVAGAIQEVDFRSAVPGLVAGSKIGCHKSKAVHARKS